MGNLPSPQGCIHSPEVVESVKYSGYSTLRVSNVQHTSTVWPTALRGISNFPVTPGGGSLPRQLVMTFKSRRRANTAMPANTTKPANILLRQSF